MSHVDSGSEGETGEKPLRERLKQTSIAKTGSENAEPESIQAADETMGSDMAEEPVHNQDDATMGSAMAEEPVHNQDTATNGEPRAKATRKRSLGDLAGPEILQDSVGDTEPATPSSGGHMRKKTRELRVGEGRQADDEDSVTEPTTMEEEPAQVDDKIPVPESDSIEKEPARAENPDPADNAKMSVEMHTPPADADKNDEASTASLLSPRKKRSRDALESDDTCREQKIPTTEETRARRSTEEERPDLKDLENDETNSNAPLTENGHVVEAGKSETAQEPFSKLPAGSGFANTSAISPFGAMSQSKSPSKPATSDLPQTSASAFAASGFAAMSGTASPLASFAKTSDASRSPIPAPAPALPSTSSQLSFGGLSATSSAFGATSGTFGAGFASSKDSKPVPASSGFGSFTGSAFGNSISSGFGSGPKLSSFAAGVGDTTFGSKSTDKPFGAPDEDESEVSGSEDDSEAAAEESGVKEDENEGESATKFKLQEISTGEENEDTILISYGKLFEWHQEQRSWKERGQGNIKLNVPRDREPTPAPEDSLPTDEEESKNEEDEESKDEEDEEPKHEDGESKIEEEAQAEEETKEAEQAKVMSKPKPHPRLVMRTIATHKLILNTPIFKGMKPTSNGKVLSFTILTNGKMIPHTLKMRKEEEVRSFLQAIQQLQDQM